MMPTEDPIDFVVSRKAPKAFKNGQIQPRKNQRPLRDRFKEYSNGGTSINYSQLYSRGVTIMNRL